ncbi:hypothetical protein M413DRAFT_29165 [Hebeloma cylindrosporum]|uniref:Mid2 domain-containing protein n=1 Tax=Hebeloma cylindrosporum TaxID=76867 RepID=A0A0C3BRS7_HEBCY|nr:hypothetical protein M413DRAFT_29165 [Hebeloma cylindrosporum h7]
MFCILCTLALALALVVPLDLATALILQIPRNPTSGGEVKLTWINEPNDPATWDLGLVNGDLGQGFPVTRNVDRSPSSLTLPFPVFQSGYILWAFVANDFNKHFATSSSLSINPATSSSSTDTESSTDSSATSSSATSSSTESSSTTSSTTPSSSTTSSVAGYSGVPQPSFTANSTTATPSSSSISSTGLSSGEIAGLASSIPIGVIGLILTTIGIWYAKKQTQAGKPFFGRPEGRRDTIPPRNIVEISSNRRVMDLTICSSM